MGLAERLRNETRELHARAERSGVMPRLLRGELDRRGYCALLRNLHAIYAALEPALYRCAGNAVVGPVVFPALFRQTALERDLEVLHGPGWSAGLPLLPAAHAYADRVREVAATSPERLVAHAYVRSLGDLSGGQVLRAVVSRSLGLAGGSGTAFYDFGPVATVIARRQAFRRALDGLPADAACAERIVAEARSAFELHAQLFIELGALHGA